MKPTGTRRWSASFPSRGAALVRGLAPRFNFHHMRPTMTHSSATYSSARRVRAVLAILPAALLLAGVTAFTSARARFHAHLVRAEPAVNDTIATAPKAVRLWFSEPVELGLSRMKIVRVGGDTLKTGALRHEGAAATTAAADFASPSLAPGSYVVTYHVVARDGHPTNGNYTFVVRGGATH
jgi:copper resistance protein C